VGFHNPKVHAVTGGAIPLPNISIGKGKLTFYGASPLIYACPSTLNTILAQGFSSVLKTMK